MFIAITGAPGTGKTTLAAILEDQLPATLITSHELVERVDPDALREGRLADHYKMQRALLAAFEEVRGNGHVVVDGFPRNQEQATLLPPVATLFVLNCRIDIAMERQLRRARPDDTPELVRMRTVEQAALLVPWAREMAGDKTVVNTTYKTPEQVARGVLAFLRGEKREAY